MEGVKEFCESTTIHGFAYISTTRRLIRLFWICVVIAGFTGAAALIQQSFSSWASSPVSTTIETLPISDLDFPNVTVCPPRNSFTSLNPDLLMSRNITFNDNQRKELDIFEDSNVETKYLEFTEYSKEEHLHWYTGISKINVPHSNERGGQTYKEYNFETTSPAGSFSTPYFKQPFDQNKFERYLQIEAHINVPQSGRLPWGLNSGQE